ncbi:protein adenylyltransferase SelO [Enemella sp. A6]|uniref:protein adenylyltransferase SelO n=1 Tax=Enemella sp. A6 TaxID=3440152 RepID=UPI003EBAD81B
MDWGFDNSYARELVGFYRDWQPGGSPAPELVVLNDELAVELGLDPAVLRSDDGLAVLSGNAVPEGAEPIAQAYAGHQFGHFNPMLGDGRAVLLGEVVDAEGRRRDIAFKGSGRTPFSRGGDGKAVIGPVLREYLMGEAMHALGIPTTRALAAVTTGESVLRQGPQPGAILTRVAASHLRVGTFELVARHGTLDHVRKLADYAMARHYPDLAAGDYAGFLSAVVSRQARLIAAWMSVGFIHGVMNTDNMTISGETIDYGPCAFLDAYQPDQVFSSIDTHGRYRYDQQPAVAAWNLARFAETLLPLMGGESAVPDANERIRAFFNEYETAHRERFAAKTELPLDELLARMQTKDLDFTTTFRELNPETNPIYIPRNHLVEEALAAAAEGNYEPFEQLLALVRDPFTERPGMERYAEPAPADFTSRYVTYCGT